ncbi:histidine triad (HIT) family protein [Breznakia sp. PF5-3]|uniref:HIT family protein n=1 Tax=unclassified Breznakia TaxID=2623764 RepID=UPI002405B71F|nr:MULTISPECIES: HIT family protein [unclassified Breznakia]MDL2276934.1 HIT family protein [Breznakia sp. OttesenSCG-928-G09]MDF9823708.1 histidine triad (HIT) family protein [Breznakia sp. PM6-1]MDF9834506.1 histidine triad (HIT) family protein [Breznakia sp. PF5-3]MDF9837523.1 histidine triad (HIT) family protein [Breznakia sp. PFB2-8]MDF9859100.1 histidine triad (HIT) family protein [Breznakia sp. PH5-24]
MCLFCKIINNEIPSYKLYEDEHVLAFLDISQVTKGHTLVISKKHYENFLDCNQEDLHHVMDVAQKIANQAMLHLGCSGINILSNVNEVAGQSVFHFHVHVIPRYSDTDDCVIEFKESPKQDLEALQKLLKQS